MKKILISTAVAAILIGVIAPAAFHPATAPSGSLEIGVLMPFSESFAWWGDSIRDSIELSQKDGYMSGAHFVYADTKCDTKDAVSAMQSLKLTHPNMHLFIVGCDNDLKAMYAFMDPSKDLAFMAGLSDQSLYEDAVPTVNLAYRLEDEATAAAAFAASRLGAKTLGIMTDDNNFGGTLASTSAAYFRSIGGSSAVERMSYNEKDPGTSVLKVLAAHPDAIYLQNDIPGMSAILKRLAQLGYAGARIMYYGGRDQSLIETAGAAAEGAYVTTVMPSASTPKREAFERGFMAAYGTDPFITAYFIRDGMELLDAATRSCGADSRCIESYFYSATDFNGTLGPVRYEPNGEVRRAFLFQQIRDGKFVDAG